MATPIIASELLQFTSAMQGLANSIPEFSVIIQPLLDALKRSYKASGKRTKLSLHRVTLQHTGWCQTEIDAFENCKLALSNRIRFAHCDHGKRLCFYVDASDIH